MQLNWGWWSRDVWINEKVNYWQCKQNYSFPWDCFDVYKKGRYKSWTGSTRIVSDHEKNKIKWNIETFTHLKVKFRLKKVEIKKDSRRFSVSCSLCSQAAILYSKYQFLSQAPQTQNTWCMPRLVYIDNCMGKFPPQMCHKLVSCAVFKAIVTPFSRVRVVGFCSWNPLRAELKYVRICYAN